MSRRRWVLAALAAAAIVLVAGRALAALYVDFGWYRALGLPELARANLTGAVLLRGGSTVLATLFLFASLYAVRRSVVSFVLPRQVGDLEFGEEVPGRFLVATAAVLAIAVGSLLGIDGAHWPSFALALAGLTFGERDPYFDHDLGFYVAWLPAELLAFAWAQRLLLVTAFVTMLLYALTPSLRWRGRSLYVSEYVRRHLTVLGGVLLILFAWAFRLESYQLLLDGSGVAGSFAAVDLQVRVPGALVLAATSLAAGLLVLWAGVAGQVRLAFFAVSVMLLLSVIVRFVLPVAFRSRDEASAARPFLETRSAFTRRAYGADQVQGVTPADAGVVRAGPRDVAVWDAAALRRKIDGAAAVGWAASPAGLHAVVPQRGFIEADDVTPWTVARIAAWTADAAGDPQPVRLQAGEFAEVLAPVVSIDTAPAYRIVADGAGIVAGMRAASRTSRIAHAWALQNFRIALGALPSPDPTVVLHPQLHDRLRAVLPFLVRGEVPRPAVAADTLFWIVDVYTASSTYPLSEPLLLAGGERRYFQPAGHAVVNSATGVVRVAAGESAEPLLAHWRSRYPSLFVGPASLPPGIQRALLPPLEAARARASTFARLGATARSAPPERRHVALEHGADSILAGDVVPLQVADGSGLAFVTTILDERDRIAGVVVTSGAGGVSRWLPANPGARRWADVLDALRDTDSTAARRDARPVRGRVRVIPAPDGLVFAQPTYLWPVRGGPSLVGVGVLAPSGAGFAPNLAMDAASGDPAGAASRPVRTTARDVYGRMRAAMRRGDWAAFGALLDTLGRVLDAPPR